MSGWATAVTTLGASGITGIVGYFSARWQGRVGLQQAHEETERLRTQHREDHLRSRQEHYQALLDEVSTFDRMRRETDSIFSPGSSQTEIDETLNEEKMRFKHIVNTVCLLGTQPVRLAADRLKQALLRDSGRLVGRDCG